MWAQEPAEVQFRLGPRAAGCVCPRKGFASLCLSLACVTWGPWGPVLSAIRGSHITELPRGIH